MQLANFTLMLSVSCFFSKTSCSQYQFVCVWLKAMFAGRESELATDNG